jgi:signal peptidase II
MPSDADPRAEPPTSLVPEPADTPALLPPAPPVTSPPAHPAQLAPKGRASTAFLCVVALASLVADLVTKAWAKAHLSGYDVKAHGAKRFEIVRGHVDFIFAQNPGGAWSFLRTLPDSLRRPFFLVVSSAAIVFIVSIYQRVHRDQAAMRWGLPLALGGAMGNLADRIRYGWVVDFIDTSLRWGGLDHHWPTFNVADIAIVLGVGLMAIDMLRSRGLSAHDGHPPLPGLSASR